MLVIIGISLVGVGGQLDVDEIIYLLKKPIAIAVTAGARFIVMPAVSFTFF